MANKKKRCIQCKGYFDQSLDTWIKTPKGNFHHFDCVTAYNEKQKAKARRVKDKERKKRKRAFYEKDIPTRRKAAVYWFNRFIRLRDAGNPCISCGAVSTDIQYHAGHFVPAGSCTALRFNEKNCHLQCARCNLFKSGNLAEYRDGLIRKIGARDAEILEGPQPPIKITAEWYAEIEKTYKAKCKELEKR
jgi:hypothetical protein